MPFCFVSFRFVSVCSHPSRLPTLLLFASSHRYADSRGRHVSVRYERMYRQVCEVDPDEILDKWTRDAETDRDGRRRRGKRDGDDGGPASAPMRPDEVILVGKLRRAVQRATLRSGAFNLYTVFHGVDFSRRGRLPWDEVWRAMESELDMVVETDAGAPQFRQSLAERQLRRAVAAEKALGLTSGLKLLANEPRYEPDTYGCVMVCSPRCF